MRNCLKSKIWLNPMNRWLEKVPTILWMIACSMALYIHAEPSEVQDIFVWSWLRFAGLILLCTLTLYCWYSFRSARLMSVNNYITYLVIVVGIALEVSFRVKPDLIPGEELILHAPKEIRKQYALSRGYMTEEVLSSEKSNGLIYHFHPNGNLAAYPHVEIDSYGYRNPFDVGAQELDCVLLGDSLTLALEAKEDLGALLRKQGHAARNLGMFGYSPQQYRDVYKKFIIDAHIRHRYVLVFVFAGNDIQDAHNYQQVQRGGGDFRAYLPQMKSLETIEQYMPIMVSVVRGLPRYLKSRFVTNRERIINLPYRTIRTGDLLPPPHIQLGSENWNTFIKPLGEIITMARGQGATPVVFLIPSAATVYSQYDSSLVRYDADHQVIAEGIRNYLAEEAVPFTDLREKLRSEIQQQFIYTHENDYHLNTIGVQKVSDEVLMILSPVGVP